MSLNMVARLVRNNATYGGAYIEPVFGGFNFPSGVSPTCVCVLRGNNTKPSYNRLVAYGTDNGRLYVCSIREPNNPNNPPILQQEAVISGAHSGPVAAIAYDPNTSRLVTGGVDGLVRTWQINGALGSLSITPVSTITAGFSSPISGLGFATNSSGRLLIVANEAYVVSAYAWNNGSPAITPIWQTFIDFAYLEPPYVYPPIALRVVQSPDSVPYVVVLPTGRGAGGDVSAIYLLLNPDSGEVEYRIPGDANAYNSANPIQGVWIAPFSPFLQIQGRTYVYLYNSVTPMRFGARREVGSHSASATAIAESSGYLAVGYADGLLRVYTRQGNNWTLSASNSTEHANARIVGVFWSSSNLVSVDSQGRLRKWNTALQRLASIDWSAEASDAAVQDSKLAVIGHEGGAARGIIVDIASFVIASNFAPPGNAPSIGVRFAGGDLVTLTANRCARLSGSTVVWQVNLSDIAQSLEVRDQYLYIILFGRKYLNIRRVSDGGGIQAINNIPLTVVRPLGPGTANGTVDFVAGVPYNKAGGAYYHRLFRGELNPNSCSLYNSAVQAILPDEPLCVANDSSNADRLYVGCADGSVIEATLPAYEATQFRHASLSPAGVLPSNLLVFAADYYDRGALAWGYCDTVNATLRRLQYGDGLVLQMSNPLGNYPTAIQLSVSPQGNRVATRLGNRLDVWDVATLGNLGFGDLSGRNPRAIAMSSDTELAVLESYKTQIVSGNYSLWAWRLTQRNSSSPGTVANSFNLVDNNNVPLHSRWGGDSDPSIEPWARQPLDFNSNGLRVAVLGYRADPNDPNPNARRSRWISVWQRSATTNWNWSLLRVFSPGNGWLSPEEPHSIHFHPTDPGLLYVGFNNNKLRVYDVATGALVREFVPTKGNVGTVQSLAIGRLVNAYGIEYTMLAFGGSGGISVWATSVCRAQDLEEVAFYNIDSAHDYLYFQQVDPNTIRLVYGTAGWLTVATIDAPSFSGCPEDTNTDGIVDDADLLNVLFNFGAVNCRCPADINCDGIVDDADLLSVLFKFGSQC